MGNVSKNNEQEQIRKSQGDNPGSSEWIRMQKDTKAGGAETNVEGVVDEEDEEEDLESLNTRDSIDDDTEAQRQNPVSH